MIIALDAHYPVDGPARTAGVLFADWQDGEPLGEIVRETGAPPPYQAGAFYRRELPGLLAVIKAAARGEAAGGEAAGAGIGAAGINVAAGLRAAGIEAVASGLEVAVVDGYVWLGPGVNSGRPQDTNMQVPGSGPEEALWPPPVAARPGLGFRLWEALGGAVPVVGVAKSSFAGAPAVLAFRRSSRNPLFVTSIGIPAVGAARCLVFMHGAHRIPTLLKRTDRLARGERL